MPRLIVKFGGATRTVPLGEEAVTFGRTPENSVPLDDVGVSRRHAQILFIGKGWEVVDLGSRNGTKVNGQKVPRKMLQPGDVITLGPAEVVFQDDAAAGAGGDATLEIEEVDLGGDVPSPARASAAAAGPAPTGDCVLRVLAGERAGTEIPLKGTRITFGRRPTNTVTFQDSAVSGVHCEITREPNGYVLRDLGSTNGTAVDGEPVVETVLRHNSRIRIGAERLVFVDTTVADLESSLAVGDEGSDWGLMRGEVDVSRTGRRGGAAAVVASVLVVAAVSAGAFLVVQSVPRTVAVPPVKDNRISDFSFEDAVVQWFAKGDESGEEGGTRARIAGSPEKPSGASGAHSLEVTPSGGGLGLVEFRGAAQAATASDATVTPDAAYEIAARVGGGTGSVVITWVSSSRPGLVREVSTTPVKGDASWPETRAVVTAPAHATGARILLAAHGGTALFDDVVFRRADGAGAPSLDAGDLRVRIDNAGCIEAVRGGEVLLTQAGLAPSVDAGPADLLGASVSSPPALAGSVLSAAGTLPGGAGFRVQAEAVAGGAKLTALPAAGGSGALTLTSPPALARGSVTLVLDRTALVVPEEETFRSEGVRKVIVGTSEGPKPFVLSADPRSPGFVFSSRRTSRGLRIQLAPPAAAPEGVDAATVFLSVDLSREDAAAAELLRGARDLETAGKLGQAAEAFSRVALEYHYLTGFRDQATKAADALLEKARERLREARALARSARQFRSVVDLETAVARSGALARDFEGHPIGAEAAALGAEAAQDLARVRAERVEARVERIYQRAVDYRDGGQPTLALVLMEEILRIAPEGNEFRDSAVKEAAALRQAADRQAKAFFGPRP